MSPAQARLQCKIIAGKKHGSNTYIKVKQSATIGVQPFRHSATARLDVNTYLTKQINGTIMYRHVPQRKPSVYAALSW